MEVTDLTVARGGVRVLSGVSFVLGPGEALVLKGPNGIGKTTLLRAVAGLQPVTAGRIESPPDSIAYAGHADGVKATLTVAENLEFWAEVFGGGSISAALRAFALDDLADRPAGELSAGQKRRLGLSRLILTRRPVWIVDEPTVSLDRDAAAMFATAVSGHLAKNGAALMATHVDIGLARARVLDLTGHRADARESEDFDEAFL